MSGRFGIRIKTQMTYETLEDLLKAHCKGEFEINFEGLEEHPDGNRKIMMLRFQTDQDRDAVRAALRGR